MRYLPILLIFILPINLYPKKLKFASIETAYVHKVYSIVLTQLYRKIGYELEIKPLPSKRAENDTKLGKYDGEIGRVWAYGEQNPDLIRVATPISYIETTCFVRDDSEITITSIDDLKKYRVAIVRGIKHLEEIGKQLPDLIKTNNGLKLLRLVSLGRVDISLIGIRSGVYNLNKEGIKNVKPLKPPLKKLPMFHYLHSRNKDIATRFDSILNISIKDGSIIKLFEDAEKEVLNPEIKDIKELKVNSFE